MLTPLRKSIFSPRPLREPGGVSSKWKVVSSTAAVIFYRINEQTISAQVNFLSAPSAGTPSVISILISVISVGKKINVVSPSKPPRQPKLNHRFRNTRFSI